MRAKARRFSHGFTFSTEYPAKDSSGDQSNDDNGRLTRVRQAKQFLDNRVHLNTLNSGRPGPLLTLLKREIVRVEASCSGSNDGLLVEFLNLGVELVEGGPKRARPSGC